MQNCDSTCQHCARHFFKFYKQRMKNSERHAGRSGEGDFGLAAATSIRVPKESAKTTEAKVDGAGSLGDV